MYKSSTPPDDVLDERNRSQFKESDVPLDVFKRWVTCWERKKIMYIIITL